MKKPIALMSLLLSLGIAGCAGASPRWEKPHHREGHSYVDSARVISARPIYETVRVRHPEERCWDDYDDDAYSVRHDHESYTAPLVGAIVGGVVGNQFGRGSGKTALTVAGGLLGASIANDLRHDGTLADYRPRHRRRCESFDRVSEREEIVGYRVKYRYKGRIFHTRMDHDPGDRIRVRVTVRPID